MAPQGEEGESNNGGAEERERLVSMLPARQGPSGRVVLYQGCWLAPEMATSIMLVQAEMEPRADNVILATFPKCGTTWLKSIVFAIANRSLHPVVGGAADDHPLLTNNPHALVPFLELPNREVYPLADDLKKIAAVASPRVLATHMPLAILPPRISAVGCRLVYLCRDPKDMLVSMWHYINKISKDSSFDLDTTFELFIDGVCLYGPFWDHYLGYWKQSVENPDRVLFLRYEELIADPIKHVKALAEFLHVPFTDDEVSGRVPEAIVGLCSFETLKSLPVNSTGISDRIPGTPKENSALFRAGKIGDWKNHLTQDKAKKLDSIVKEKLAGSGLTF